MAECQNGLKYKERNINIPEAYTFLRKSEEIVSNGFLYLLYREPVTEDTTNSIIINPVGSYDTVISSNLNSHYLDVIVEDKIMSNLESYLSSFSTYNKGICFNFKSNSSGSKKRKIYTIFCPFKMNLILVNMFNLDPETANIFLKEVITTVSKIRELGIVGDYLLNRQTDKFAGKINIALGDSVYEFELRNIIKANDIIEKKQKEMEDAVKFIVNEYSKSLDSLMKRLKDEYNAKIQEMKTFSIPVKEISRAEGGLISILKNYDDDSNSYLAISYPANFIMKKFVWDDKEYNLPEVLRKRVIGYWVFYYRLNNLFEIAFVSIQKYPPTDYSDMRKGIETFHSILSSEKFYICEGSMKIHPGNTLLPTMEIAHGLNQMFETINYDSPLNRKPADMKDLSEYLAKVAKQKSMENKSYFKKIPGSDHVKCTCQNCKFEFKYDPLKNIPRACPYCNGEIPRLRMFTWS